MNNLTPKISKTVINVSYFTLLNKFKQKKHTQIWHMHKIILKFTRIVCPLQEESLFCLSILIEASLQQDCQRQNKMELPWILDFLEYENHRDFKEKTCIGACSIH